MISRTMGSFSSGTMRPELGETQALNCLENIGDEEAGVLRGVFGEEFSYGIKIFRSLPRPPYFSHRFIFSLTLLCVTVCPASACCKPRSTLDKNRRRSIASS